jgi:hypothetical protein
LQDRGEEIRAMGYAEEVAMMRQELQERHWGGEEGKELSQVFHAEEACRELLANAVPAGAAAVVPVAVGATTEVEVIEVIVPTAEQAGGRGKGVTEGMEEKEEREEGMEEDGANEGGSGGGVSVRSSASEAAPHQYEFVCKSAPIFCFQGASWEDRGGNKADTPEREGQLWRSMQQDFGFNPTADVCVMSRGVGGGLGNRVRFIVGLLMMVKKHGKGFIIPWKVRYGYHWLYRTAMSKVCVAHDG